MNRELAALMVVSMEPITVCQFRHPIFSQTSGVSIQQFKRSRAWMILAVHTKVEKKGVGTLVICQSAQLSRTVCSCVTSISRQSFCLFT